jgi:hypothetical protein
MRDHGVALRYEIGHDLVDAVAVEVEERDGVPVRGEAAGDALTDARGGAGDDRDAATHLEASAGVNSR